MEIAEKILGTILAVFFASTAILGVLIVVVIDRLREVIECLNIIKRTLDPIRRDVKDIERKVLYHGK